MDKLNVMYCLTGESDLWVGEEQKLLPNKSTDDLFSPTQLLLSRFKKSLDTERKIADRREKWSGVLSSVSSQTDKPILVHVLSGRTSGQVVTNPGLLSAMTVQTGHDLATRRLLWELPLKENGPFINLEPWYEGILNQFGSQDQLYAYWASMMAGAHAYCYGAHGIWNGGDGKFLAHWGKQSFDKAAKLDTPRLLGESHKLFLDEDVFSYKKVEVTERHGELTRITRLGSNGRSVSYIPNSDHLQEGVSGKFFLPTEGKFSDKLPNKGQVVVLEY